jgi:thioredoxin reductase (NADPH)
VQENELYDLIIVGGGPGGLSAGIHALRAALTTILIENCCVDGRCGSAFRV